MKTIRILIYTDNGDTLSDSDGEDEGVSIMRRLMCEKLKKIVNVGVTILNRHHPAHGATKLTCDLLKQFDELWVIGWGNTPNNNALPALELTDDEVYDLSAWMYRGGVMVTGDHSQPPFPKEQCEGLDHKDLLARGFPLGQRIPRAGQLRVWKGPPTNCDSPLESSDIHHTLGKNDAGNGASPSENDEFPQQLEEMQPPHFLFFYGLDANGQPVQIRNFPDHQHEGNVIVPATYDKFWPPRPPVPQVVAQGRDLRFPDAPRKYDLVMAYDGDAAGVGRIVADSSFHHFINLNLCKIPTRDAAGNPVPGTPLDQIAQFYANLALWLAPAKLRESIREQVFFRAFTHIIVLEALGNSAAHVGRAVKAALASQVGGANVLRILEAVGDDERPPARLLKHSLAATGPLKEFSGVDAESTLGATAQSYHQFIWDNGLDPLNLPEDPTPPGFLDEEIERAFSAQLSSAGLLRAKPADDSEPGGDT
jgi:hypothetical protein